MKNGLCNRITRKFEPDAIGAITINTLNQFISLYDNTQKKQLQTIKSARSARKTMKKTRTIIQKID
jgi:hypothetical protein